MLFYIQGVGEPPLFMGASVFYAIRDAVKNASNQKILSFHSPATVANIRMACDDIFSEKVKNYFLNY